jgi:hypothetical protein
VFVWSWAIVTALIYLSEGKNSVYILRNPYCFCQLTCYGGSKPCFPDKASIREEQGIRQKANEIRADKNVKIQATTFRFFFDLPVT